VPLTRNVLEIEEGIPFQRQTEHLARLATGQEEQPVCSGVDGLAAVKVCEAVIEALEKGDGYPVDISVAV